MSIRSFFSKSPAIKAENTNRYKSSVKSFLKHLSS